MHKKVFSLFFFSFLTFNPAHTYYGHHGYYYHGPHYGLGYGYGPSVHYHTDDAGAAAAVGFGTMFAGMALAAQSQRSSYNARDDWESTKHAEARSLISKFRRIEKERSGTHKKYSRRIEKLERDKSRYERRDDEKYASKIESLQSQIDNELELLKSEMASYDKRLKELKEQIDAKLDEI